jgi:hypothetical protein
LFPQEARKQKPIGTKNQLGRCGLGLRGSFRRAGRVAAFGPFTAALGYSLGAADYQLAAHVFLVVKLINCALGLLDGRKRDESESFGALSLAVANNLDVLYGPNAAEELHQVTLRRIEREIAYVDAGRGHLNAFGLPRLAGRCTITAPGMLATGSALRLAGSLGLFFATESDDGEELGKEALLLG